MSEQPFPGFHSPAAGPDEPLLMLSSCHERMARQFATLRRLVLYLRECGCDAQARQAAQSVLRYFDTAAPLHHQDEEKDLFPALLESMAGSDAVCLREMTDGLAAQHREIESRWGSLRVALQSVAAGTSAMLGGVEVDAFIELNRAHIEREESELLPMAARLLSDDAIESIGRGMRARHQAQ